jgi:thiol-disulfide isomerase/thioredoxin
MARFILLLLLLLVVPVSSMRGAAGQLSATGDELAPAFALKDTNGGALRLSDYKGKVLLINFWATWCAPCFAEIPDLMKLEKEYRSRGLEIIGIAHNPTDPQTVLQAARRLRIDYPILFGTREVSAAYRVGEILPVTIVVDREGKIRARILGILAPEEFEQSVKPLLENERY